jgi:hypothetical protein
MRREIRVYERTETVTIVSADVEGTYRVTWHRSDGEPDEEFHVTPAEGDSVEEAVRKDLHARLGP